VWPSLVEAFPQAEATLADAAEWARQASACLDEMAAQDLATLADDAGLDVPRWLALSPARRGNALRAWLRARTGRAAPASLVTRLMDELTATRSARWPIEGGVLRAYRGRLRHEAVHDTVHEIAAAGEAPRESTLSIRRAGRYALPGWGGALDVERVKEGGVPLAWLAHVELRPRAGGERFQSGIGRPPRSLKKQYQAAGRPAWERDGPLVYSGGQLVFVPGLGIDARVIGLPGQPMVTLHWHP
jgi:tRNA(Ile)-lysidine synthase